MSEPVHKCEQCGWFCRPDGVRLMPSPAELKALLDCVTVDCLCAVCAAPVQPELPKATVPSVQERMPVRLAPPAGAARHRWDFKPEVGEAQLPAGDRRETTD